ncbi:MAG: hypothetical protein DRI36_06315 [Caldiserica bacterium]|nr:MAG: hypothetical protein DRI36_06315 [Caldisericota bacterium]
MKIQTIAEVNLWWKFGKDFHFYDSSLKPLKKKPIIFTRSKLELKPGNIYIIRGPRQVGKTVWIKQTIRGLLEKGIDPKSIFYLPCDLLTGRTRKEFSATLRFYLDNIGLERKPLYIFLDEITAVDEWNIELKVLADVGVTEKCAIVVTGSNPWKIKEKRERLPGRGVEGNEKLFFPLTFREFVLQSSKKIASFVKEENVKLWDSLNILSEKAKEKIEVNIENREEVLDFVKEFLSFQSELQFLFRLYLITGGFPESINSFLFNKYFNKEKNETIDNYVYERFIDVVKGDLGEMIRSESSMRELISVIIRNYGNRYSFTDIANGTSAHIDHKTAMAYSELLKEAQLTRIFYSYDFSKERFRLKADKKIYFYDPFLFYAIQSWLTGKEGYEICLDVILNDDMLGHVIEGIVGNHLAITKERLPMQDMITFLWFYYDKSREIDFIYRKKNGQFIGIEVKYQNNVSVRDIAKLDRIKEYFLISKDSLVIGEIPILPANLFLFSLKKSDGYI